ncbi:MAG: DUF4013 domain-containing protein [Akkermansiaceae bacterium]|jgi:MFS family permease
MNYFASITDFFKPQKWGMNMFLGGVCILIPMIGPIIVSGWAITQLWGRGDEKNPSEYPPFDFQYFTKYLMRGMWSFLAQMVGGLIMMPVFLVLFFVFMMVAVPITENNDVIGALVMMIGFFVYLIIVLAMNFIIAPISIAATIAQDFVPAFNIRFLRNFLTLVWRELLISTLFFTAMGIVMMILGVCTCYIGFFAGFPVITFAWQHLLKQLYLLHLSRGGIILTRSPKLSDLPPGLPQALT